MSNVPELVFARFYAVYGPPRSDDVGGFLQEYEKALAGWDPQILAAGIDRVVKTYKGEWNWPVPGYCTEACQTVANELHAERMRHMPIERKDREWPAPSEESKARVRELVRQFSENMRMRTAGQDEKPAQASNRDAWEAKFGHRKTNLAARITGDRDET